MASAAPRCSLSQKQHPPRRASACRRGMQHKSQRGHAEEPARKHQKGTTRPGTRPHGMTRANTATSRNEPVGYRQDLDVHFDAEEVTGSISVSPTTHRRPLTSSVRGLRRSRTPQPRPPGLKKHQRAPALTPRTAARLPRPWTCGRLVADETAAARRRQTARAAHVRHTGPPARERETVDVTAEREMASSRAERQHGRSARTRGRTSTLDRDDGQSTPTADSDGGPVGSSESTQAPSGGEQGQRSEEATAPAEAESP